MVTGIGFEYIENALCKVGLCCLQQIVADKAEDETSLGVDVEASESIVQSTQVARPIVVAEILLELKGNAHLVIEHGYVLAVDGLDSVAVFTEPDQIPFQNGRLEIERDRPVRR